MRICDEASAAEAVMSCWNFSSLIWNFSSTISSLHASRSRARTASRTLETHARTHMASSRQGPIA
jgi:hypothetical protein